ncbi:MAG: DUF1385 domain-containing protein [Lachnospiraceae bacterium]|nr:DUF1385 domain-containing protein [Lachnospiraceae bacterium]
MKSSNIGGQAVMEGIMMRHKDVYSVAVRKPDGTIELKVEPYKPVINCKPLLKVPFVRGVFNFVDSLVMGISCLMYSASFFEEEEEKEKKELTEEEKTALEKKKEKEEKLFMAGTLVLSLVLAVGIFFLLPYFLTNLLRNVFISPYVANLLEAVLRIFIFFCYMVLISRMKDIQRTFEYHGAEHKCINCIENGWELTVENVLKSSRLHKRCGTSFLFFVMIVSAVLLMLVQSESHVMRLVWRLVLIPVVAGVSYEIIRLAGNSDNKLIGLLSKPGLALQQLTTREPDAEEAEVAIAAVEAVFDWKTYLRDNF